MKTTVNSRGDDGTLTEITIEKTGPNKGKVKLVSWAPGAPKSKPTSKWAFDLYDIRANPTGTRLTCDVKVPIPFVRDPRLELVLKGEAVSVIVTGVGARNSEYPVDPADAAIVSKFIVDCAFPPI